MSAQADVADTIPTIVHSAAVNRLMQMRQLIVQYEHEPVRLLMDAVNHIIEDLNAAGIYSVACPQCGRTLIVDLMEPGCKGHCTHCEQRGI